MHTESEHETELRQTGIEIIGDTPWGTHFCNFYETKQDLHDILVPFFRSGLENNEYCVYITTDSISIDEALITLRNGIPGFEKYNNENRIDIISYKDWYLRKGRFDAEDIFKSWDLKLEFALLSGFAGLRINGNAAWLERNEWNTFIEYEKALSEHISDKKIMAMCIYPLDRCFASDVLDVAHIHSTVIAKRKGVWEIFETPDTKRSKAQILKRNEQLRDRIVIGTEQLKEANLDLESITQEQTVTEEALERSEANLSSIFENTGTGLILLDTKMRILLFNGIANNLAHVAFGKPYKYGESMFNLIADEEKDGFKSNFDAVLEGKMIDFEHSYPAPDGSAKWFHSRMYPIKIDGGINIGICISAEDITERKKNELEKENATRNLIDRNIDLEQFSYMVSHNLRVPVANILGFSNMAAGNNYDADKKSIFIEQINASAKILDEVIRDMNIILQVKTENQPQNEKVKFISIVNNIKKIIQDVIEKENAVIIADFTAAETINGNRAYLYSIFLNLISNSIKYHQPGVPPVIEILTKTGDGKLFIIFKDNGLGIDLNKNSDKVFGLYKRFHADIEGKGMGLFMVKTQVNILGGKINIESNVNKGTTFTIELNQ